MTAAPQFPVPHSVTGSTEQKDDGKDLTGSTEQQDDGKDLTGSTEQQDDGKDLIGSLVCFRQKYTDLATIDNSEEMKLLNGTVLSSGLNSDVWIGLYTHIDWKWSDGYNGSGAEYRRWLDNEPHNNDSEMCVVMEQVDQRWLDYDCEKELPVTCNNVHRQVVKLRMKPVDPSVDLNDPAVKAAVLKKLQDRLKEQGVSGVNLKWREQPDGKVFHKETKSPKRKRRQTEL
ncbi:uncharacterized protein V6R79_001057 [Siganus canaliculatus]